MSKRSNLDGMIMQFKKQGSKIYLLRSVYDSDAKRCRQVMVGKIPAYGKNDVDISGELAASLTEEELKELQIWLEADRIARHKRSIHWNVKESEKTVNSLAEAFEQCDSDIITEDMAVALYHGISRIQKVLKKCGFAKSKLKQTK